MPQFFWNQHHSEGLLRCNTQLKCCKTAQDFNLFEDSILAHNCIFESDISNTSDCEIYLLLNRER